MSAFTDLWVARGPALDAGFGEPIAVRHVAAGQFLSPAADSANPQFEAIGILDVATQVRDESGRKYGDRGELVVVQPQVDFAAAQFGPGRLAPVPGSVLVALARPGTPSFRVSAVLPADDGRVLYQLEPL